MNFLAKKHGRDAHATDMVSFPRVATAPLSLWPSLDFSPNGDFETFLKSVPARWVVYLLTDAADQPIQLLCVKNLRNSLKCRLGVDELIGLSRRVNYRELVGRIYWRPVDSAFEADWVYCETAREIFPKSYRGMVGFRPAWFIHIDCDADFPRYTKTIDLSAARGLFLGPVRDQNIAARLMAILEDVFDLCRFHNILLDTPHAKACAYKEMGKCPAPCDGSISMGQYRQMIERSLAVLLDPEEFIREQTIQMQQAAGELRFETAAKIKACIGQVATLGKGPFQHVREREKLRFVSLQRGPREGTAKVFLITPGGIKEIAGWIGAPLAVAEILQVTDESAKSSGVPPNEIRSRATRENSDAIEAERIGIVAHHLFLAKQTSGVFLPLDTLNDKTLAKGLSDLQKQKVKESDDEDAPQQDSRLHSKSTLE